MAAWSEGGFSLPTQRWCAGDGPRLLRWENKAGRCVTTALEIAPFSRSGDPRLCRARSPAGCLQDHMCTNSTGEQWQGCLTDMPSNAQRVRSRKEGHGRRTGRLPSPNDPTWRASFFGYFHVLARYAPNARPSREPTSTMAAIIDKPYDARMAVVYEMLPVGLTSMVVLGLILVASRILLPIIFPKRMAKLTESRRFFVAQCVASGIHALVSGPVATYALYQLLFSGEYAHGDCPAQPNAGTVRTPPLAVWVTGFTCGYFVYDSLVMTIYPAYTEAEMGRSGTMLMWVHHVISVIVWPYCIASDRAALFVVFFLFTELTNIGQVRLEPTRAPLKTHHWTYLSSSV